MRRAWALLAATAAAIVVAAPASAADPARWRISDVRNVPLEYFQGLTHDPAGNRYFDGVFEGLYKTDADLVERVRVPVALPASVQALGFNHIGDFTWNPAEGGRLILPLECYTPGGPNGGNTCGRGAFGVADPATLGWRYLVRLDPADIPKAMWAESSPDGQLVWTSSGKDLVAYGASDVSAATAAAGTAIRPVRRLTGAVPPSGVTGGAFFRGRLLIPGQNGLEPLQIWSVDVNGASPQRLEVELPINGESEGVDVVPDGSGLLHYLISPFAPGGRPPTYGSGHSAIVSFVPAAQARLRLRVAPKRIAAGSATTVGVRVTLRLRGRRYPVAGATVAGAGATATTQANGIAALSLGPQSRGTLRLTATKQQLRPGRATIGVG
ncbi:MAG TPA: hypothetical protein VGP78_05910 [Solirubrobacteraceae bacterium]|nr:hypothetical protein [Solirubrobacteraceae bacterium]